MRAFAAAAVQLAPGDPTALQRGLCLETQRQERLAAFALQNQMPADVADAVGGVVEGVAFGGDPGHLGALGQQGFVVVERKTAVLATEAPGVIVRATAPSRIAIIGGENVGKRFIDWNFVSSCRERIEQAKNDWVNRRFPTVPGDEIEFIPLPQ